MTLFWMLYPIAVIIAAGVTAGAVAAYGRHRLDSGMDGTCQKGYCGIPSAQCKEPAHQTCPPTIQLVATRQAGWLLLGLIWPLVLAAPFAFLAAFLIYLPIKYLFLGAGYLTNWGIRELTNPRANVKEVES